jgi:hypothetical protein
MEKFGSGINIQDPQHCNKVYFGLAGAGGELRNHCSGLKILNFLDADPGWKKIRIRDPRWKNSDPGSEKGKFGSEMEKF